jgi:hypothetical protein
MVAQASQPAPPLSGFVDVPESVEAIVMRAIAKDPTSRFGTMREFGAALAEPVEARPYRNQTSIVASATRSVEKLERLAEERTEFVGRQATLEDQTMLRVARPSWPAAAPTVMTQVVLRIRSGPTDIGREFELSDALTRIGRGQDNDIVLDDRKLSRFHASIERIEDGFVLRDLNAANGTRVNGVRAQGPVSLQPMDRISLGDYVLEITYRDAWSSGAEAPSLPVRDMPTAIEPGPVPIPRPPPPLPPYSA